MSETSQQSVGKISLPSNETLSQAANYQSKYQNPYASIFTLIPVKEPLKL